jgi:hypothetical protein
MGGAGDPWCTQVLVQPAAGPLYVAVRYQETMCRQVRVQPTGCGCDDAQCEYSRWRDGFEIAVLSANPSTSQPPPSFDALFKGVQAPDCPDCPSSPWVVLAQVTVGATGAVTNIDNCTYRRLLVGWSNLWWQCTPVSVQITVDPIDDQIPGAAFTLTARTQQSVPTALEADLGANVEAGPVVVTPPPQGDPTGTTLIVVSAQADSQAQPGPRQLTLEQKNGCILATAPNAFTIQAAAVVQPVQGQSNPQPAPDLPQPNPKEQPARVQAPPAPHPAPPQPSPAAPPSPAAQSTVATSPPADLQPSNAPAAAARLAAPEVAPSKPRAPAPRADAPLAGTTRPGTAGLRASPAAAKTPPRGKRPQK